MNQAKSSSETIAAQGLSRTQAFRQGAVRELKKFVRLAIYFWVWFYAINLYANAVLAAHGHADLSTSYSFIFIGIKAAICAKFLITAELLFPMGHKQKYPMVIPLIVHSLIYLVFVLLLSLLERVVEGLIHHRAVVESILTFASGSPRLLAVIALIYWLIIVHYLAFIAVDHNLKDNSIRGIMLEKGEETSLHGR